ncbi:DUF7446 family protein [Paenibacillus amylolyticus]|uniref:DUF7446 family protein n=1 Tax=Paenibacillus amylolyticus TaxID=1451 RepID=UPI000B890405|nr:hypothetical protein [Paenibacillus amylolyticus]
MIKWENYKVVCTFIRNQIVIAKIDQRGSFPSISDKSTDRTDEIVGAVYQHMRGEYEQRKEADPEAVGLTFTFADGGTLVYSPPELAPKEGAEQ